MWQFKVSTSAYLHVLGLWEEIHAGRTCWLDGSGLTAGSSSCEVTVLPAEPPHSRFFSWVEAARLSPERHSDCEYDNTLKWECHTDPHPRWKWNASLFLLTWESVTGGISGILRRRYSIQQLAASLREDAAISIKPPLSEQRFTLLAAAPRDEFWWREENVGIRADEL